METCLTAGEESPPYHSSSSASVLCEEKQMSEDEVFLQPVRPHKLLPDQLIKVGWGGHFNSRVSWIPV